MIDDRDPKTINQFPLRKIRLDMCICGHDDSDHQTVIGDTGVGDGECALCVCKGFELPVGGMR